MGEAIIAPAACRSRVVCIRCFEIGHRPTVFPLRFESKKAGCHQPIIRMSAKQAFTRACYDGIISHGRAIPIGITSISRQSSESKTAGRRIERHLIPEGSQTIPVGRRIGSSTRSGNALCDPFRDRASLRDVSTGGVAPLNRRLMASIPIGITHRCASPSAEDSETPRDVKLFLRENFFAANCFF